MAHQQHRQRPPEQRQRRSRQAVSPALMGSKSIDECEIKVRGEWLRIEIEAALGRYAGKPASRLEREQCLVDQIACWLSLGSREKGRLLAAFMNSMPLKRSND
jgi:hypothetical protein